MIYLLLFLEFLKIGLFTFGGGYAMIPLIEETAIKHNWLTENEFYSFIGICESTPGPIAINMATYIGAQEAGLLGSICATLGVVLPSFVIILLIASLLKNALNNKYVQNFLSGVKPVVVGLILSTGSILLIKCIGYNFETLNFNIKNLILIIMISTIHFASKTIFKKKLSTISLILISAILGIGVYGI